MFLQHESYSCLFMGRINLEKPQKKVPFFNGRDIKADPPPLSLMAVGTYF